MRDELRMDDAFAMSGDLRDALAPGAPRRARLRAAAAAITSLCVLIALVVWTYRLGARDPNEVPVIRAAEGPAKIRPEDPGGERFDHQGRAVYHAISGGTTLTDEVALAPAPQTLEAEDAPAPELSSLVEEEPASEAGPETEIRPEIEPGPEMELGPVETIIVDPVDVQAPFATALVDPTPRAPLRSFPAPSRSAARSASLAPQSPTAGAPTLDAERVAEASEAPPAAPAAPGSATLQLGAYLTPEDARRMWETIRGRNRDLLAGRQLALETLDRGGQTLHLLRVAPFADGSEARALCVALKARGEDCLVPSG